MDVNELRRMARECHELADGPVSQEVADQLRLWAAEYEEEAVAIERAAG